MTGSPEEKKPGNKIKKTRLTLKRSAGLIAGIILLVWFAKNSDLSAIADQLAAINIKFLFLLGITFCAYLTVTLAWKFCFINSPGLPRLFIIRLIGESLAQINPTNIIAGEALKAILLKRKGISFTEGIVSITISRFIVILSAISIILIGITAFFDQLVPAGGNIPLGSAVFVLAAVLILIYYLIESGRGIFSQPLKLAERFISRLSANKKFQSVSERLIELDRELIDFYKTKKLSFIISYMLSFSHWLFGALEFYVILALLGFNVTFFSCIAIEVGVMAFKAAGAFVPGQIGVEEYASKMMLGLVNISGNEIWLTVSILRRARQLFWIGIGFFAFFIVMHNTRDYKNGSAVHNA